MGRVYRIIWFFGGIYSTFHQKAKNIDISRAGLKLVNVVGTFSEICYHTNFYIHPPIKNRFKTAIEPQVCLTDEKKLGVYEKSKVYFNI